MECIDINPKRRWHEYLRAAHFHLERDGAVLLLARSSAAHRPLRRVFNEFRLSPECRRGEITAHFWLDKAEEWAAWNALDEAEREEAVPPAISTWQLLIAPSDHHLSYDGADGVVEAL